MPCNAADLYARHSELRHLKLVLRHYLNGHDVNAPLSDMPQIEQCALAIKWGVVLGKSPGDPRVCAARQIRSNFLAQKACQPVFIACTPDQSVQSAGFWFAQVRLGRLRADLCALIASPTHAAQLN